MIYLSGKIRGENRQEVQHKFMRRMIAVREQYGVRVVNPVMALKTLNDARMRVGKSILTDERHRKQIMDICLRKLSECDAIYVLPCWEDSSGARAEVAYAISVGMKVIFELDEKEVQDV